MFAVGVFVGALIVAVVSFGLWCRQRHHWQRLLAEANRLRHEAAQQAIQRGEVISMMRTALGAVARTAGVTSGQARIACGWYNTLHTIGERVAKRHQNAGSTTVGRAA